MSSSPLTFYFFGLSQPARAVNMLLEAGNIKHETKLVNLLKGEQKGEEYLKVNPFGVVPAITHGDFCLNESVAILRYLCSAFKLDDHWYPSDLKKKVLIDAYLGWQHAALRKNGVSIFLNVVYPKLFKKEFGQEERVATARTDMEKALVQLETIFLKDTPFIYSDDITIADLLCVSEILQPMAIGYDVKGPHPKVTEYILRVRSKLGESMFDSVQKFPFELVGSDYFV